MNGMLPPKNLALVPFDVRERVSLAEAAAIAGKSESTIRTWCIERGIGRRVGNGTWAVSCVALQMFLNGDLQALRAYLSGDRKGEAVRSYFIDLGLGDLTNKWSQISQSSQSPQHLQDMRSS